MAREILIIRHGETDSNAARVVQKPDAPLSERGRTQARHLARRLADEGVEAIVSSDLARAHSTALAVQELTGAPLRLDALLQERNFGELRGTPYTELGDLDIFAYDFEPPAGETGSVFDARVDRAWSSIQGYAEGVAGRLAVVTHGLVCRSLAARHLAVGEASMDGSWGNTSLTIVEGVPPWRVLRLNCTDHLDESADGGGAV